MSLQAFNSVKNITLDNNNYLVLSQNRTGDEFQIDYTWGKVHFQTGGTFKNGTPEHVKLRMLKNDVWYDYAGISGHGAKLLSKYFTFVLITEKTSKVKKFRIPLNLLFLLSVLLIAALSFTGYVFQSYFNASRKILQLDELRATYKEKKIKIDGYNKKIEDLSLSFDRLNETRKKMKSVTGLELTENTASTESAEKELLKKYYAAETPSVLNIIGDANTEKISAADNKNVYFEKFTGYLEDHMEYETDPFQSHGHLLTGITIGVRDKNSKVPVTADGIVIRVGEDDLNKKYAEVYHNNAYKTRYALLSDLSVKAGDVLKRGDIVGQYRSILKAVNALSEKAEQYSEVQIRAAMDDIRKRAREGVSADSLLPEVFAYTRVAASRTLGQRHFDVQIIGGIALHEGQIAEMKTGEGKTLTATLAVALNAVSGKGVHLVTVNDYLAKRDKEWMQPVYEYLGFSVGLIQHDMRDDERKLQYQADITYGTNSEFGFDYLRDNMKYNPESLVQRGHHYAIVDEVDSILIDEARTPLIISGATDELTDKYHKINSALGGLSRGYRMCDNPDPEQVCLKYNLTPDKLPRFYEDRKDTDLILDGDYALDEKSRNIQLTESGAERVEIKLANMLKSGSLYDFENIEVLHHVNQSLKAKYVFKKDIDYVVKDNRIVIVDEFTGRLMEGRRYSDGLHQALEAKEYLQVEKENRTLATITYQNYFRKYEKLAGMTGTATTEEEEFQKIYRLSVFIVPTNRPVIRIDHPDAIYKTKAAKNRAITGKIKELYEKGSRIPHNVLNAKYFEQEAAIIADAGRKKSVTIATNMAGRGTDIKLTEESVSLGGLYILGTIRHESRRIDNQLRGRSGRQGDPGESKYFISLEDDLLRIFGGERIARIMTTLNIDEDEPIEHYLISKSIENSQKSVEGRHFSVRKHLLEYDDVVNRQREIIYKRRREILFNQSTNILHELSLNKVEQLTGAYCLSKNTDDWSLTDLKLDFTENFGETGIKPEECKTAEEVEKMLTDTIRRIYDAKIQSLGEYASAIEKQIFLDSLDNIWKEHLINLDHLKESVGLSAYAQKNPLDEYKKEAYNMFAELMYNLETQAIKLFYRVQLATPEAIPIKKDVPKNMILNAGENKTPAEAKGKTIIKKDKIGRNDPCHCGSGKKI
ncbi:hypothetical protein CHS0354_027395 [Potamilus streckersoni]|uniref:Protein translocase subunit SecA n=1 Tax=Potamilus streckersoni TaxID=2493646 RepID=A0AAE0SR30_9BIVA|nr:hypothetical protein CHS0354_027395 [Potamilus streckersoni]